MPDFEGIIKNVNAILQLIFGKNTPSGVTLLLGWTLLCALFLCAIWGLLLVLSKIKDIWVQSFKPLLYKPEQKRLSRKRQTFAKHIEYEIIRLDLLEDWKDDRFAELEAEVEAEGKRRVFSIIPFLQRTNDQPRREKTLSKALTSSEAKFILIEGEPGSGKSVALRYVAQKMARQAKKSKNLKSIIPIYVNLKELERTENEPIDRNLIESFVKKTLTRSNDRDVEQFLEEQFATGTENGSWFFLFDSFDEIPEILSSTEADQIIKSYGDAIADFLQGGMNTCRGIIASRQFRGPKQFGWPHFRVLALKEDRQLELIRKIDFEHKVQNEFLGQLSTAAQEIRFMASNPLFLALLCEQVKSGHPFPKNAHSVFETYVEARLKRDETRLQKRFGLSISKIRTFAENIAFCMASDTGIGLSPSRDSLRKSAIRLNLEVSANFDIFLDALEYSKLGRPGGGVDIGQSKFFTFAHRRFQEYFATCVVLRNPQLVPVMQLLTDARWRETTVAMCQTQPIDTLTPILDQAEQLLQKYCNSTLNLIENPLEDITTTTEKLPKVGFPWPTHSLHLLSLLQEGFSSRLENLPNTIRTSVDKLVVTATEIGRLDERKWALEVAGTSSEYILEYLLKEAFLSKSQWLKDTAYHQVSLLKNIPSDVEKGIYNALLKLANSGRLRKEKHATRVHLSRLKHSDNFLHTFNYILHLPTVIIFWNVFSLICVTFAFNNDFHFGRLNYEYLILYPIFFIFFLANIYFFSINRKLIIFADDFYVSIIFISTFIFGSEFIFNQRFSLNIAFLILMFIIIIYMIILNFISNFAISTGFLNRWILWATVPLFPIAWLFIYYRREIKNIFYYLFNSSIYIDLLKKIRWTIVIKKASILLLLIFIFLLAIYLIFKFSPTNAFSLILGIISSTISLIFLIILIKNIKNIMEALQLIPKSVVEYFRYGQITQNIQDWLKWQIQRRGSQKSKLLTFKEFWSIVNSYHAAEYRLKVIKSMRAQNTLNITEETKNFLKEIAWEAEKQLETLMQDTDFTVETVINKSKRNLNPEDLSWVNPEVVDEIYMLLEEIRVFRQGIIP